MYTFYVYLACISEQTERKSYPLSISRMLNGKGLPPICLNGSRLGIRSSSFLPKDFALKRSA
jgi:hypothetical protein